MGNRALGTGMGGEVSGNGECGELGSIGVGDFSQVLGLPLPPSSRRLSSWQTADRCMTKVP